ncbi:hypothetical protein B0I73DRAFT_164052 [Yarrowia lipolytica]|jgi:hypothetical protein|uniref:YALI0C17633p n=2 Tax=Yarrowia lipolytica TaxID=4952 RepID=Q6CBL3_YARLI|nr:YALI0C17633p [Yarrowia lipolytica CLIB122]AOW03020.1 hypothetical protein YALI1_C24942g [Yarrowia lipolytica]KAB8283653.1 hypothetical protein BKA91DRAFT_161869 [Yarrowia lipolytica]KAE8172252.1 hypothetical protein BKA90DRAFT_157434 [Yarrowia lipolytica]KAJ8053566.1 hypothetical protein LXG23DRAFT_22739 [Yarrowia lipolytica]RDW22903.1 hypothetical protein B0I71DRAFT_169310 [Yarrowia lipolytica]|eukprot:XP_501949.1 YALI0C17633p [Yarrowia lipolytica CLIB122]
MADNLVNSSLLASCPGREHRSSQLTAPKRRGVQGEVQCEGGVQCQRGVQNETKVGTNSQVAKPQKDNRESASIVGPSLPTARAPFPRSFQNALLMRSQEHNRYTERQSRTKTNAHHRAYHSLPFLDPPPRLSPWACTSMQIGPANHKCQTLQVVSTSQEHSIPQASQPVASNGRLPVSDGPFFEHSSIMSRVLSLRERIRVYGEQG